MRGLTEIRHALSRQQPPRRNLAKQDVHQAACRLLWAQPHGGHMATQALKSVDDVTPASPPPKRTRRNLFVVAAAATAMLGALAWWIAFHSIEQTDDAQIDGDVV